MDDEDLDEFPLCGAAVSELARHRDWHIERGDEWPSTGHTIGDALVTLAVAWTKHGASLAHQKWRERRSARDA